ncbi:MAG: cation-translocating P-type ATPase [Bdellovibrionota bacterium]
MLLHGLSSKEVIDSRNKHGSNKLPEERQKTAFDFLKETFENKLNMLLLIMTIAFIVLAAIGYASIIEPIGIGVVIVAITLINIHTGLKSQKNAKILKDKASVRFCNVLRDGGIQRINANDVVVGDVILLQTGEAIQADGFLIDGRIKVDNSVLNGESKECFKKPILDYVYDENKEINSDDYVDENSLFSGAIVTEGEGKMLAKKVGINTQNGKTILSMQSIEQTKTSLEIQLEKLAKQISVFGYVGAVVISVILLLSQIVDVGFSNYFNNDILIIAKDVIAIFITAITIIVAAVPEGLPLIINLITAQNAKVMLKNNVLAKNTSKIPEAGNIELLCTDKTGTLTKGVLTPLHNISLDGKEIVKDKNNLLCESFLENISVNNSAMFDDGNEIIGGNATDRALLKMVTSDEFKAYNDIKIERKLAFNSTNKYSATQIVKDGKTITYYKGAPEKFLEYAKYFESEKGLQKIDYDFVKNKIKEFTSKSMRVVATGFSNKEILEGLPDDLVMTSLVAIRDDIRPECVPAVKKMHGAGVQVMMITGDVLDTARAIAKEVGIIESENDIAISAIDLEKLSDEEIKRDLSRIKVIARATPQTKLRIINLAQELNLCVGMTGDGTNDAPALKRADVGFSMGTGTDLCKEAGDIIITDDNFVSITSSVLLGRTFMHNIMKFLKFQLPVNICMVLLCVIYPLFFGVEALVAVQILLINIVIDALVSLSFGGEPCKEEYMTEKPIKKGSSLVSKETSREFLFYVSFYMVIFFITMLPKVQEKFFPTKEEYLTVRFALLVLMVNINGFNIRTESLNLFKGISLNPMFVKIFICILVGTFFFINCCGKFLSFVPLNLTQWVFILLISSLIIPADLLRKLFLLKRKKV